MLETRKIFCNFAPNIEVDDTSEAKKEQNSYQNTIIRNS